MRLGYDQPRFVLPDDHRSSFSKELFGWAAARRWPIQQRPR
jgi:hypothetical protein